MCEDMYLYMCVYVGICICMYCISQLCPLRETRRNKNLVAMAIAAQISWFLNSILLKRNKVSFR